MKKLFLFLLCLPIFVIAQDGINYQGAATDNNGDELINQNITLRASVISGSVNGNLEWEETHSTSTDQFGLFSVVIGQGINTSNGSTSNFDNMDWGSGNHFLKIEMDANGGTNYSIIGTTQMMSVPYALYAKSSGSNSNLDSLGQVVTLLDSLIGIISPYLGCIDPSACNYDSLAVINDGSCTGLFGCTDNQSSNYDSSATCDDGSCIPYVGMYAYGGVVYKVIFSGSLTEISVCNVDHQIYTQNNSNVSGIANGLTTNGYTDWIAPSSSQFDDFCSPKNLIDIIAGQNGATVSFGTNDPYLGSSTTCNGTNGGAGPYSYPYYMSNCTLGGFSGNCCCLTAPGYFRSIRVETF